jgi:hypothetical protein
MCFVLKAPGDSLVSDHQPEGIIESNGMRKELSYADVQQLHKVVFLQQ